MIIYNRQANGGSELMARRLENNIDPTLLRNIDIYVSRVESPLDPHKKNILWVHDLAGDPMYDHLYDGGWKRFTFFIFVSFHQRNSFIQKYDIDKSVCYVIENAIEPFDISVNDLENRYNTDVIKLIYTPTPHRGLNILYLAFETLAKDYPIELDVYSSFKLYGCEERDKAFADLFRSLNEHDKIRNHGSVSNDEIRKALLESHLFVYPSIWEETSCLCLIEAAAAGNLCIHSSLGALPETSKRLTTLYQSEKEDWAHVRHLIAFLENSIRQIQDRKINIRRIAATADIFNNHHNLSFFIDIWTSILNSINT